METLARYDDQGDCRRVVGGGVGGHREEVSSLGDAVEEEDWKKQIASTLSFQERRVLKC